ncbi:MAG: bifunctional UDP-N-acetylglucosamine diphosphorylase/glucosamine-1-phosphate N-acetyltransferase GlmU [Holosporales bacterium]|nr:bifunctional UDP-N-acetylglucosamine diphosphorylase/glucosamine-1-phosphate N-acetyltransferase GlmU [Holosporales bacterium]
MKKVSSIILAAGKGSRFGSKLPKIRHTVGGLPLFCHVIKSCMDAGAKDTVLVISSELSGVLDKVPLSCTGGASVKTAVQPIPLGTGDAVLHGFKQCSKASEWVVILYADTPLIRPKTIQSMLQAADSKTGVVVLAMKPDEDTGYAKLVAGPDEALFAIVEEKDTVSYNLRDGCRFLSLCNAGMLIKQEVAEQFLDKLPSSPITEETYITNIVELAREAGWTCHYVVGNAEELRGVNTRADLAAVEKSFQERMRRAALDNCVGLTAPETVHFSYDTIVEPDATIHPFVTFGPGAIIRSGSEIRSFCVIENAEVKQGAIVGPFARIRPGSAIQEGAHIGNFVEVKKSTVGVGAKINHLSYIGDASIGDEVNIGAGTITCNYDGFKKHQTTIGNKASIGANSSLVAPVNIGARAILGAGSVITEDVPEDALALERAPQVTLKGKAEKIRAKRTGFMEQS